MSKSLRVFSKPYFLTHKKMTDNIILIGNKPVMNYVTAILIQLKDNREVIIKGRGSSMKTAIDAAEITSNKFLINQITKTITSNSETLVNKDGVEQNVSSLKIILKKI